MENNRTQTSTQIRNMYSDGMSYMNIKFYNTNLSFHLYPFSGKDQNGRSRYDTKHGQQTTVNFEGAFALYQVCKDIIEGEIQETNLPIPCIGGSLTLERKMGMDGMMETIFSISKNNVTIPFKFATIQLQVKENGQVVTKQIEVGLGVFVKTIDGYLTGINAERHLNKLTDDFAKLQENKNGQQPHQQQKYQNNNINNNYRKNNNYNKNNNGGNGNYNHNNNYHNNNYNNNGNNNQNYNNSTPMQRFDDYQLDVN